MEKGGEEDKEEEEGYKENERRQHEKIWKERGRRTNEGFVWSHVYADPKQNEKIHEWIACHMVSCLDEIICVCVCVKMKSDKVREEGATLE